jgi:hypothetical protein
MDYARVFEEVTYLETSADLGQPLQTIHMDTPHGDFLHTAH